MGNYTNLLDSVIKNLSEGKTPDDTIPGKPDKDGFFQEQSTKDGNPASSLNPTIPAGFKPVDTSGESNGSTWGEKGQAPSKEEVDKGLVIEDKEGNQFVWVPCYVDGENDVSEEVKTVAKEYGRHTYINPSTDTSTSTAHGSGWRTYYYTAYKDWKDEAYEKYGKTSVEKYGGFYVARYEAGIPETADFYPDEENGYANAGADKKNPTDISGLKPVSKANTFSWNYVEQSTAKDLAEAMYNTAEGETNVKSYLIDGYAWDTIVEWINDDVALNDSTDIGNYYNSSVTYNGKAIIHARASDSKWHMGSKVIDAVNFKLNNHPTAIEDEKVQFTPPIDSDVTHTAYLEIPTGSVNEFKQKNIYDMAGNMWEWTTEVGDHEVSCSDTETPSIQNSCSKGTIAVLRGGGFYGDSVTFPLCYRGGDIYATFSDPGVGFRVVLYL